MFYSQYDNNINNYYRTQEIAKPMNSYIRVLHAAPNAPAVDIYANGNILIRDLAYNELSEYLPVPPENNYNIMVFPSGEMTNPVINTELYIPANTIFNIAAVGELPDISLYPIPEPTTVPNSGRACVRFVHLSPNAPAVDIKLTDGMEVFNNVEYLEITDYICVPSGTYNFDVVPTGTDNVVLSVPNIQLSSNNVYTIYAVGLVGESPALEVLLVPETR